MSEQLSISGIIKDREGKAIDNRHAHWMVHQLLVLLKWCGLEFIGHVSEVKGEDIYRTGVVEADPFAVVHEKPIKVRYRRRVEWDDAPPALSIVPSSPATNIKLTRADGYQAHAEDVKCAAGQTCYVAGHLTTVCRGCLTHQRTFLVNRHGYCTSVPCQALQLRVVKPEATEESALSPRS